MKSKQTKSSVGTASFTVLPASTSLDQFFVQRRFNGVYSVPMRAVMDGRVVRIACNPKIPPHYETSRIHACARSLGFRVNTKRDGKDGIVVKRRENAK